MDPTNAIRVQPVDFARVLMDLNAGGRLSMNAVALHANIARSSLRDYLIGTQPSHVNGERLIALWCQVTGNHRDRTPKMHAYPGAEAVTAR